MGDYYSRRNQPFTKDIDYKFWNAFKAYINELVDNDWLYEEFGGEDFDYGNGRSYRYVVKEKVNRKMLQEIGRALYPLPERMPAKDTVFDLIEFFFKFISVQVEDLFDRGKATYQYTIRINQLFENFKLSYKLEKGIVKDRHSGIMDRTITKDDFVIEDKETQNLIGLAIEKFFNRSSEEQKIALEKLVDAFQRVSSWENSNKPRSVKALLGKVCKDQEGFENILQNELNGLWKMANEFMIRHTELDKIKITDTDVSEYLFYRYYTVLRFILKKYGSLKEIQTPSDEDFVPDDEDFGQDG